MNILPWLIEATVRGSACILLVWLLRPLFRRWLGARAAHLLWLAVLVPLLAPWLPASPFAFRVSHPVEQVKSGSSFGGAQILVSVGDAPAERVIVPPAPAAAPIASGTATLLPLWSIGFVGMGALALLRSIRAARLVRRAREISGHPLVLAALAQLPDAPRSLRIRETGELRSPALCGILRPTILLPLGWWGQLGPEEFRCVLLHEVGHLRRGDLLWRWAFLLAQAVHWFNPLLWLAARSARLDQELACDEWVLARNDSPNGETYGEVLLKAASLLGTARLTSPVHATMAETKTGLTRRIRHLTQVRPRSWPAVAAALSVAALAIAIVALPQSQAQDVAETPQAAPPVEPTRAMQSTPAPATTTGPAKLLSPTQIEIEAKFVELTGGDLPEFPQKNPARGPANPSQSSGPPAITSEAIDALLFGTDDTTRAVGVGGTAVYTDSQFQVVVRALNEKRGVDLLSAPRMIAKSGQHAVIEIIREFRYPSEFTPQDAEGYVRPKEFGRRNTGVTLDVLPELTPEGRIELTLKPEVVDFLGFVNYRAGRPARPAASKDVVASILEPMSSAKTINQPIFSKRKITTTVVLEPGETVLIGGMGRSDEQVPTTSLMDRIGLSVNEPPPASKLRPRSLYIFVTAKIADAAEVAALTRAADAREAASTASGAPAAPGTPSADPALPGAPVPNKPGFLTSPYAPSAGYIDVRGFPPGTELKCPYTGKLFLVP